MFSIVRTQSPAKLQGGQKCGHFLKIRNKEKGYLKWKYGIVHIF